MFIIQLKFSDNKSQAKDYMEGHKTWLQAGFERGIFVLSGSLQPNLGGGIIAHNVTRADIDRIVAEDPFVVHKVVTADIIEFSPSKSDPRLEFLLE